MHKKILFVIAFVFWGMRQVFKEAKLSSLLLLLIKISHIKKSLCVLAILLSLSCTLLCLPWVLFQAKI